MAEAVLRLNPGETAVVGYGSLLSKASIAKTLGRAYDGPFHVCNVEGWRRTWDAAMPNRTQWFKERGARVFPQQILYLNATKDSGPPMNAVVFVVAGDELAAMNRREWIYDAVEVTQALRGCAVTGGKAILYSAKAEHTLRGSGDTRKEAVRASYLRILAEGLEGLGEDFRSEYRRTTDDVPKDLVIEDEMDS
jgi:hypothetical protein